MIHILHADIAAARRNFREIHDGPAARRRERDGQQAPEGALLHVNGVSNMRRDLPFLAIVPRRGRVQSFRLSEAYRARGRDKGAALKKAETEIRAAIAAAGL